MVLGANSIVKPGHRGRGPGRFRLPLGNLLEPRGRLRHACRHRPIAERSPASIRHRPARRRRHAGVQPRAGGAFLPALRCWRAC